MILSMCVVFSALYFLNRKNYNSKDTQSKGKDEYHIVGKFGG